MCHPTSNTSSRLPTGSKAMDYSNGLFDCQSPSSPFLGGLRVLHLLEDLRGVLELMDIEERDNLRCQIPDSTAEGLAEWLQGRLVNSPFIECYLALHVWPFLYVLRLGICVYLCKLMEHFTLWHFSFQVFCVR